MKILFRFCRYVKPKKARSFARNADEDVGVLDIDITGPSQTLFMGVKGEDIHKSATGWEPLWAQENIIYVYI